MSHQPQISLMTLKEVAERLHQSVKTVRRRIAHGQLPAIQLSRRAWRVDPKDLEQYERRSRHSR